MPIRDSEGIILDMLDDIVRAETKASALIDRLESISRRSIFRVVNIKDLKVLGLITLVAFAEGFWIGYLYHGG